MAPRRCFGAAAMFAASLCLFGAAATAKCLVDAVDVRGAGAEARFAVEIADTPEERARGLMFREQMDRDAGMLFVFEQSREVAFWMRNTPLPLDIIFVDSHGVVVRIAADTTPFSETPLPSGAPVTAVLEINAGLSAQLGIAPGAELRHPAFSGGDPAWPCGD
jgi:uncharacterized membrane protein (UPF0127 family)